VWYGVCAQQVQCSFSYNVGSYTHQGTGTAMPNANIGKVQSQYQMCLDNETGWTAGLQAKI
jgi:hypothetical protein